MRALLRIVVVAVVWLGFASPASAGTLTLTWDPSPSTDVAGYLVVYGTTSGVYPYSFNAGTHTFANVDGLVGGVNYYFAIRTYSSSGDLSTPSNEIVARVANGAPSLASPGPQVSSEGTAVHLQLFASDPDGDPLVFSATGLPSGLSIDSSTGLIFGTPTYTSSGVYAVTLTVSDGVFPGSLSTSQTVSWTVLNVNGPPVVAPIADQLTAENAPVSFAVAATDPDGDVISWNAVGLPAGLTINVTTGQISGTPTFSSAGMYAVTVIASAAGQNGRQTFEWTITNVDRPPVLTAIPNQTSGQYATIRLDVTASDPDGDVVAFSASGLPPGLVINQSTARISGTLSPASVGSFSVTVTASAGGLTDTKTFSWTVTDQVAFPLMASGKGRYLIDQNNVPFLMIGDSPQSIIGNLTIADATTFLTDRKNRGFNTVWINLLCKAPYGCSLDGTTVEGIKPFTTPNDLSTPNPAYFAKADAILSVAASLNLLVILDPIETGAWISTLESNSLPTLRSYGQYLGNRYSSYSNIIWMSGNDFESWRNTSDDARVREVALGIRDVNPQTLQTIELDYANYSSSSLDDSTWTPIIGLNAAYTYYPTYFEVLKGYNAPSLLPVFMVEANYEGENNFGGSDIDIPVRQRRQEYWTALSGATGQLFGNAFSWTLTGDWQSHLNTPGAIQLGYLKSLFAPRAWFRLVPDQTHTVVTAGYGTISNPVLGVAPSGINSILGNDYVTAAATPDGSLVMAYLPTVRAVTVDMSRLGGPVLARWFDPTLGTFVSINGSPFPNSGTASFTPPGAHADGAADWVLVLESNPGIVFTNPGNRTNPVGASVSLQLLATDPYGSPLTYTATNLPAGLLINSATGVISGTLAATPTTYNVSVAATDGTLTASLNFTWTVAAVGAPPVLVNPGDQVSATGTTISVQLVATDPDGNLLTYSATGLPPGLTVNSSTGLISGTLSSVTAAYGVTATASDGVQSSSQTFNWTVALASSFVQANYVAPQVPAATLTVPFPQTQTAGNLNVVVVGWGDATHHVQSVIDTTGNTYLLAVGPSVRGSSTQSIYYAKNIGAAAANANAVTVTFDAAATFPDIRIAEYRGIDPVNPLDSVAAGQGSSTNSDSGFLTTSRPQDLLVAASLVSTLTTAAGAGYTQRLLTSPDGDILMDRLVTSPGSYNATASLSNGGWIMQLVAFGVAGGTPNHAPTLATISDQTSSEASAVSLQLAGGDSDGNPITYSVKGLPGGLSLNAATGLISGTLSYSSAGVHAVTVTVSDQSLTTSQIFTWTVINVNRAPVIVPIADQFDIENTFVTLNTSASDPDHNPLVFNAVGLPIGLTINPTTGAISGTLTFMSAGSHVVFVTANDGQGASNSLATVTFVWTVADADRPPTFPFIPDQTNAENDSVSLNVSATDLDPDNMLSYAAVGLPAGLIINPSTGLITGTLSYRSAGPHFVTVKAFDGTVSASQSFTWHVTDVDLPPVVVRLGDIATATGTAIIVPVSATDLDGDVLTYTATGLPPGVSIDAAAGTISGAATTPGAYTVTVTVTDASQSVAAPFKWSVMNVAAAPHAKFVQASSSLTSSSSATTNVTFPAAQVSGDANVVFVSWQDASGAAVQSVQDSATNVYQLAGAPVSMPGAGAQAVYYAMNIGAKPAGSNVVTITFTAPVTASDVRVSEYSGLLALNGTAGTSGSGTAVATGAVLLSGTDLIVAGVAAPGSIVSPGASFTQRLAPSLGTLLEDGLVSQIMPSPNTATLSAPGPWIAQAVTFASRNNAPTVDAIGSRTDPEGSFISLQIPGHDLDADALTYSFSPAGGLPNGLVFGQSTGLISGTLSYVAAGVYPLTVCTSDDYAQACQSFTWTVTNVNRPPVLSNPGNQGSRFGAVVSLQLNGVDPDGSPVTFGATNLPAGLAINPSTGLISGVVSASLGPRAVSVTASDGSLSVTQNFTWTVNRVAVQGDFDGDGKTDVATFRPSNGTWQLLYARAGYTTSAGITLGAATDIPVPGDYDGDGKADVAMYRPSTGVWTIILSSTGATQTVTLGNVGDVPAPADYDGDGKTDVAVYTGVTALWTILQSSTGTTVTVTLGVRGDVGVPGDYDGDGKADLATYHQSTGLWTILRSTTGTTTTWTLGGGVGLTPVPGDYDGDGKVDAAVYDSASGQWRIRQSSTGATQTVTLGGGAGITPVPGDYDGDGKIDVAVFGPGALWTILRSSPGTTQTVNWGLPTDLPVVLLPSVLADPPIGSDVTRAGDFDGDGKSDVVLYRPSNGTWQVLYARAAYTTSQGITWGTATDVPVPGDYDGDGKTDAAYWRPSTGQWAILKSSNGASQTLTLGSATDLPVPGDYDGDGKTDAATYRPSSGVWTILKSSTGTTQSVTLGVSGDAPVPRDYDGDGKTDVAIYHPATGRWTIVRSSDGVTQTVTLGTPGQIPVPCDYDGDGKADVAVYDPTTGVWTILKSSTGTTQTVTLGGPGQTPAPADYDGDGKVDVAVFGGSAQWQIQLSSTGTTVVTSWGTAGDVVAGNVLVADALSAMRAKSDLLRQTDFDGDGKSDVVVYRPSNGTWQLLYSRVGFTTSAGVAWGTATDIAVPGDYDGDGKTDVAYYRPSTSGWSMILSSTGASQTVTLGSLGDIPVPGDYDGDRKTDVAVYHPALRQWTLLLSKTGATQTVTLGVSGDVPVPADYDGDGKTDVAVYHPATGLWTISRSSDGVTQTITLGTPGVIPVPADYDGDGKADPAFYNPTTGVWSLWSSKTGAVQTVTLGGSGMRPVPGDYDGDGIIDMAVFGPGGQWTIVRSSTGTTQTVGWGLTTDRPVIAPLSVIAIPSSTDQLRGTDFDGDGKADVVVYRPSDGTWQLLFSRAGFTTSTAVAFGTSTDVPVSGDYDGDGKTDVAYWRPSTAQWVVRTSSTGATQTATLGTTGDLPVPGDYDGDGKTDRALFRRATAQWILLLSKTGTTQTVTLGVRGDVAVPGDYDGDHTTDLAVYHPATGVWTIRRSSDGTTQTITLGTAGVIPVPGDYDGDGKTDAAVYNATTGVWTLRLSSTGTTQTVTLGGSGAVPVPGDYDGDGKTDIAVVPPAAHSQWQILYSSTNYASGITTGWGLGSDIIATNVLVADAVLALRPTPDLQRATDYDGDGKADIVTYRPSDGTWQQLYSKAGFTTSSAVAWGTSTDKPVPGDYDGDGKTDPAFFRPSTGEWRILLSSTKFLSNLTFVLGAITDRPVPGDYDGDGKTDVAIYRPSTGEWQILTSSSNFTTQLTYVLGTSTDIPVPGDYDGDGRTDIGIFRPATRQWQIRYASTNYTSGFTTVWGLSTDIPVPADYDGDGKTDIAGYRASNGTWQILYSRFGYTTSQGFVWGTAGSTPLAGDYDGDGRADLVVFAGPTWSILLSSTNYTTSLTTGWGLASDKPLPIRP